MTDTATSSIPDFIAFLDTQDATATASFKSGDSTVSITLDALRDSLKRSLSPENDAVLNDALTRAAEAERQATVHRDARVKAESDVAYALERAKAEAATLQEAERIRAKVVEDDLRARVSTLADRCSYFESIVDKARANLSLTSEDIERIPNEILNLMQSVKDGEALIEVLDEKIKTTGDQVGEMEVKAADNDRRADRLKEALINAGRAAGGLLADSVSDDFVVNNVAEEIRLVKERLEQEASQLRLKLSTAEQTVRDLSKVQDGNINTLQALDGVIKSVFDALEKRTEAPNPGNSALITKVNAIIREANVLSTANTNQSNTIASLNQDIQDYDSTLELSSKAMEALTQGYKDAHPETDWSQTFPDQGKVASWAAETIAQKSTLSGDAALQSKVNDLQDIVNTYAAIGGTKDGMAPHTLAAYVKKTEQAFNDINSKFNAVLTASGAVYTALRERKQMADDGTSMVSEVNNTLSALDSAENQIRQLEAKATETDARISALEAELQSAQTKFTASWGPEPKATATTEPRKKGSKTKGATAIRDEIFSFIKKRGIKGATADEVEASLDLRHQTASARINELENQNKIMDSGEKRRTRSGGMARVLVTYGAYLGA
jgi:chromosome segregation ATPase